MGDRSREREYLIGTRDNYTTDTRQVVSLTLTILKIGRLPSEITPSSTTHFCTRTSYSCRVIGFIPRRIASETKKKATRGMRGRELIKPYS